MSNILEKLQELPPAIAVLAVANYTHARNAQVRDHQKNRVVSDPLSAIFTGFGWGITPEGCDYWNAIHQGKLALFEAGKYYKDDADNLWEIITVEDYFNDASDVPPTANVIGSPIANHNTRYLGWPRKSGEWQMLECVIFEPGGRGHRHGNRLLPDPVDYSPTPVIYPWIKPPTSARALILD